MFVCSFSSTITTKIVQMYTYTNICLFLAVLRIFNSFRRSQSNIPATIYTLMGPRWIIQVQFRKHIKVRGSSLILILILILNNCNCKFWICQWLSYRVSVYLFVIWSCYSEPSFLLPVFNDRLPSCILFRIYKIEWSIDVWLIDLVHL